MALETLGEVTVPSGTLFVLAPGFIGLATVPVAVIEGLPTDRALPVVGVHVPDGRWDHVAIEVNGAPVASREAIGKALVYQERLLVLDASYPDKWIHDDAIDGRADFVFWGPGAQRVAGALRAPSQGDGEYGWKDRDVDEMIKYDLTVEKRGWERGFQVRFDFRPHSHYWQALERVRTSPTESATIDVDDLRVCLFMTGWGDGLFPVVIERAADGAIVRVVIQLRTEDREAAMAEVNG